MYVGAAIVLTGGLLAWGALDLPAEAGYQGVGPNFLPAVVALALVVCGCCLCGQALAAGATQKVSPIDYPSPHWRGFAWMSAGLLLNALLITRIGFVLSCTLCFVLAAHGLRQSMGAGRWRPRTTLNDGLTGLLIAAPVYWSFTQFLAIALPGLTQTGWL